MIFLFHRNIEKLREKLKDFKYIVSFLSFLIYMRNKPRDVLLFSSVELCKKNLEIKNNYFVELTLNSMAYIELSLLFLLLFSIILYISFSMLFENNFLKLIKDVFVNVFVNFSYYFIKISVLYFIIVRINYLPLYGISFIFFLFCNMYLIEKNISLVIKVYNESKNNGFLRILWFLCSTCMFCVLSFSFINWLFF